MRTWMRKGLSLILALMLTAGICLALAEGNPTIEYSDSSIVALQSMSPFLLYSCSIVA